MKKKITLPILAGVAMLLMSASAVVNSAGLYGYTGSPVDGGATPTGQCSGCHSGGSSTPSLSITASPAFVSGNQYVPSTTYTITITPTGSYARYGVNCEIINSQATSTSSVGMFGTFGTAVSTNCQIIPASSTTPYPPCVSHKSNSTTTPFSFKWTAPASGTGYIYADVLGANGDGNTGGDKVSAVHSLTLTPASSAGINTHSENEAGLNVFPNPATDNVRLTYTLNERSNVVVKLVSINGEVVADLLNETQHEGQQSVDARLPMGLAKGMYMVKLSINGKQTMQKLMVL